MTKVILPSPPIGGGFWGHLDFAETVWDFKRFRQYIASPDSFSLAALDSSLKREPFGTAKSRSLVSFPLEGSGREQSERTIGVHRRLLNLSAATGQQHHHNLDSTKKGRV